MAFDFETKLHDEAIDFGLIDDGGSELGVSSDNAERRMIPDEYQVPRIKIARVSKSPLTPTM